MLMSIAIVSRDACYVILSYYNIINVKDCVLNVCASITQKRKGFG